MTDEQLAQAMTNINNAFAYINDIGHHLDAATAELQHAGAILTGMDVDVKPKVTVYGQRDPQWATEKLGTSASTIGGYGCLITCAASILTDSGKPFTPKELNIWLRANEGYVNAAGGIAEANRFIWSSICKLGTVGLQYYLPDCWTSAAPMDRIDAALKAGNFVIVEVDFNPDPKKDPHYVRLLTVDGQMMDPWVGDIAPITRYKGANAAECIRAVAIYSNIARG